MAAGRQSAPTKPAEAPPRALQLLHAEPLSESSWLAVRRLLGRGERPAQTRRRAGSVGSDASGGGGVRMAHGLPASPPAALLPSVPATLPAPGEVCWRCATRLGGNGLKRSQPQASQMRETGWQRSGDGAAKLICSQAAPAVLPCGGARISGRLRRRPSFKKSCYIDALVHDGK